jgi:hypothetical protein
MGVYQIKQVPCYTNEHLTEDGLYELLLFRHHKSKNPITTFKIWVQYVKGPVGPIIDWYCTRKIGGCVVGVVLI